MLQEVKAGSHIPASIKNCARSATEWKTIKLPADTVKRADQIVRNQNKKGIHMFDKGIGLIRFVVENGLINLEHKRSEVELTP